MAYKPTVWVDGETSVNAENLNKLESGVAAAVVSVNGKTPDENGNVEIEAGGSGGAGADGFSPIASVTQTDSGAVITITDANGTTTATVTNGKDGADGANGEKGEKGDTGSPGADGAKGDKGDTGATGPQGPKGDKGDKGDKGATGATGATGPKPVKGTDYFTEADKEEIVQQVIAALGTPVYGTVDENNHITLSGHLVDGTYTLSFEDSDGFVVADVGTIKKVTGPSYTNQIPISTDANGVVYNGTGYKVGVRLRSSGEEAALSVAAATNPAFITGYIPITTGQTLYLKNCYIDTSGVNGSAASTETKNYYGEAVSSLNLVLCNSAKSIMHTLNWVSAATSEHLSMTPDADGIVKQIKILRSGVSFVRLGLAGDAPNAIITIDQPITE